MQCEKTSLIQAYHDHELDPAGAAAAEAHLAACEECRKLFDELVGLSNLIARAALEPASAGAIARAHEAWSASRDRITLRIASWATAAAAAVLFGALLFWPESQPVPPVRAGGWDSVALTPPEPQGESSSELVQVAQWMARGLTGEER